VSHVLVPTQDGASVALHRLTPPSHPEGPPVLLVHGAFTSRTVWLRGGSKGKGLATYLADRGHDVWLGEWRSHGAATREPHARTWHFEDTIRFDAPALVRGVREATDGRPPVWVGHSVSGAIGLAYLAGAPEALSGIVTLGTPGPVMRPLRRGFALLIIGICRVMGRFPARALRFGSEDEAALVLAEWMGWNVRGRWVGRDGTDYLARLHSMRAPLLAVAGAADRLLAPVAACRDLYERLGTTTKRFAVVGPHLSHRGLLLDGAADEQCWPLVADWIERLPAPAAPRLGIAS
jgi:pimeloyl-ACP methyl ester carboxylesterase